MNYLDHEADFDPVDSCCNDNDLDKLRRDEYREWIRS